MKDNPTAENIARLIFDYAKSRRLPVASVRLWETVNSHADYGQD
jgi:6-pyruvoyltetrahydropterin/6-carboxytetrahydropterin synthase